MGKDKNAPRAKRNQKPSSSVRSAELLGGVSSNSTGFLGFGASSTYCPTTASSDNSISQDFRLAMRKMAKKDSKTKIKALQEFEELLKSEELVSIETTLPFWPRLYTKLSLDIEKKVRESTQVTHGCLVTKVGRLLGPHLSQVVPTWVLAMCDTYPAAAAAAKRAFQSVFSEDKRPDVMFRYCKEILDFTSDNLFRQTADTLSDPNSSSPEEREEKYIRVLCSSLASVSMLQRLTQHHDSYSERLLPALTELLAMDTFWKLHKHPNPKVRSAFFECVSVVVGSGGCSVSAASLAIRAGLSDADPSVLPRAYSALFHLAAKDETCWKELGHSSSKPVPERVLRLGSDQCRGVASEVLPLLLPLLAVTPHSAYGQHHVFYMRLLQALADNVLKSDAMPSRHEVNAMHQTFFECVRFLSNDSTLDSSFWQKVFVNMIGPMLQEALKTAKQLESGAIYEAVVTLSRYWARRALRDSTSQSEQASSPVTAEALTAAVGKDSATRDGQAITAQHSHQLIAMLWQVCFAQCQNALKSDHAGPVERQLSIFLDTINNPHLHSKSKQSGVKFSQTNSSRSSLDSRNSSRNSSRDSSPSPSCEAASLTPQSKDKSAKSGAVRPSKSGLPHSPPACALEDMFRVQFGESVLAVSELASTCHLLYLAEEAGTPARLQLLKLLVQLLSTFTELQPYRTLLTSEHSEEQTCYSFLQNFLVPELRGSHYSEQCLLVQLLVALLPQLSEEQQGLILVAMQDVCSVESLRALLEQTTGRRQQSAALVAWLASPALGDRLVKLLREAFAITEALAYERQDIESEQRNKPKPRRTVDSDEGDAVEEEEEEDVVLAQQQRDHLVTVLRLMLAPTQGFRLTSGTVRQVASVLVTALPSSLHQEQHHDSADSACSNIELVLQLSSAVFGTPACWQLSESKDLLLTLFGLLCPADLILTTSSLTSGAVELQEIEDQSILSSEVAEQLKSVVYQALRSLVAAANKEPSIEFLPSSSIAEQNNKDDGVSIEKVQCQFKSCLEELFSKVTTLLHDPHCSYSAALRLADISGDCLMILSEEADQQEEWDIPLDQQAVRDAFNMLVPSEGQLSEWEAAMSTVYLAPTVMLGGSCFRNAALPRDTQASVSQCEGYTRGAVFLSAVLVRLCGLTPSTAAFEECGEQCDAECAVHGTSDGSAAQASVERLLMLLEDNAARAPHKREQPQEQGQVSLGPYCRLACVCVHAHHYLSSAVQLSAALNTGNTRHALLTAACALQHNTTALLRHMNAGNLQQLAQVVRDVAAESQTGLWCVTLQRLLQEHRGHVNVTKLLHGLSLEAYNSTAVKQVFVRFLSPAEVSSCLGSEVARMCSLTDDPFSGADVAAVVSCLLHRCSADDATRVVPAVMDTLLQWWRQADALFLFAEDVSVRGSRAEDLSVVVSVVRVVTVVVTRHSHLLTATQWERLLCAVTAWVQSLQDSQQSVERDAVLGALVCAVARCVAALETLMQRLSDAPKSERSQYPEKLVEEWQEFFCSFLHSVMLPLFFKATGWYSVASSRSVWLYCLCRALSQYAAVVPAKELCQHALPPIHHPEDDNRPQCLPSNMQVLLNQLVGGLLSPQPGVAGTCHVLLQRAMPAIMESWCGSSTASTNASDDAVQVALPYVLIRAITECGSVVAAVLEERPALGGWCVVLPHTDSHTFVLGYCLAWQSVFTALMQCDEAKRQDYASELKSHDLLPRLLTVLTKLLPPVHDFPARVDSDARHNSSTFLDTSLERLHPNECGSSYVIWWLACQLYYQSMTILPYWVRIWYNSLSKQKADAISAYTQRHFSPLVIAEEISAIKEYKCPDNTVTVRVRSQREVLASYIIDESELVLTLQLPINMPLAPAEMVHSDHAGVSPKLWEGWKNGIKTVLTYRNTPLLASLKVWKQNLDQKYQGVEPCYICYCIMQPTTHTLPYSLCRTCKKKFHSSCLYQWFLTSPTSTCPLCRSVW